MKKAVLFLTLILMAGCASCDREDEKFTPYPGGKHDQEKKMK